MVIGWQIPAAIAVTLGVGLVGQTLRLAGEKESHAWTQAAWSAQRAADNDAALRAQAAYAENAFIERKKAQQANEDAKKRIDTLAADVARAGTERERLRSAYTAAITRSCQAGSTPAVAGASQAASAPANLPADVFGRIDAAADGIAEFAERAMSASETCASAW